MRPTSSKLNFPGLAELRSGSQTRFPLIILAVELRQLFAAMAGCTCCNSLGSSPAFQLLLSIAVVTLFLLIGIYGISVIIISNWDWSGFEPSDEWQSAADFYVTSQDLAYWFGAIVTDRSYCF